MEACERKEHRRPRQLVSIIDASLLLGLVCIHFHSTRRWKIAVNWYCLFQTQFAVKLCEENKYDHDLLHLLHSEGRHSQAL